MTPIQILNRETGEVEIEQVYGDAALQLVYGDTWLARLLGPLFLPLVRSAWISRLFGWWQRRPASKKKVLPFIEAFGVDTNDFLEAPESFASFDAFFTRKLKPGVRPIPPEPDLAVIPADGRYLVFPHIDKETDFLVKGERLDLRSLLQDDALAARYEGGSAVLGRLCPTDYHRFHFPCTGIPSQTHPIDGPLYSVNPIATRKHPWIFSTNKRVRSEQVTDAFGTVVSVEIGATCVGSIHYTYHPNQSVNKGDEKGFFSFGASALILLFEPGKLRIEKDLISASEHGLEAKCKLGQALGKAP